MDNSIWLTLIGIIAWFIITIYLFTLGQKQRKIQSQLDSLEAMLERMDNSQNKKES